MNFLLIGEQIEVITSRNQSLVGFKGTIVDETKNSFVVENENRRKRILKNICTFKINTNVVDGERLLQRPYERVKNGK